MRLHRRGRAIIELRLRLLHTLAELVFLGPIGCGYSSRRAFALSSERRRIADRLFSELLVFGMGLSCSEATSYSQASWFFSVNCVARQYETEGPHAGTRVVHEPESFSAGDG